MEFQSKVKGLLRQRHELHLRAAAAMAKKFRSDGITLREPGVEVREEVARLGLILNRRARENLMVFCEVFEL